MRVLLIGNREHQLLFNLIDEIKNDREDIIFDIFSQDSNSITEENSKYFNEIINLGLPQILLNNRVIRGVSKQVVFRNKLKDLLRKKYDYVHIHYIEDIIIRDTDFFIKNLKTKLIISVWGSDFLRASSAKREQMRKLFRQCNRITISNTLVIEAFKEYYKGEEFCNKIVMLKFFVKPLNDLMVDYDSKKHVIAKQELGIDTSKTVLTIGYNASRMQQHLLIFEELFNNSKITSLKDNLYLILPLTYPKDKEYIELIKSKLEKSGFSYSIFTKFLSNDELLRLRYSSDIFVQLQTTDMMSGSMLEYLALGNLVITGSWLPYSELLDDGIVFTPINSISELPTELLKVDLLSLDKKISNSLAVKSIFDRNELISKWLEIYR